MKMHRTDDFKLPMSNELLTEFNFFELYPFDGGGNFINAKILGGVDDLQIAKNILNGALDDFGSLPCLDFAKFERWRSIEKSCWLNRFYFIVPLAKYYKTSNDEEIAVLVKDTMLHFIRNYSPPQAPEEIKTHLDYVYGIRDNDYNKNTYEENQLDETDVQYIWFDFQPASRIIHFLYALHFIKDSNSLTDSEFSEMLAGIKAHAQLIAVSEGKFEKLKSPSNHQSIRGLSLLYAGTFFDDDFFLSEGIRICKFHIENDYFIDGVLKEISPSYHVFETWHVRDAYILSKKHDFIISEHHKKVLRGAAEFARSIQQPDNCSTIIDDGYALSLLPFLRSLPENILSDDYRQRQKFSYYPDAQLGFYSDAKQYICFDASLNPGKFSHYHAGKNALTYFYEEQPIFVDSGCCSYDDPKFLDYKRADSHSSLLVNGAGDGVFDGLYYCPDYTAPECSGWQDNKISSTITSTVAEWENIIWHRTLKVEETCLKLSDQMGNTSGLKKEFTFIFNLHPDVQSRIINRHQVSLENNKCLLIMNFNAFPDLEIIKKTGQCFINSKHQQSTQIHVKIKSSANFKLNTKIE
jgi:Heparinase II/III N-terminus/Heparinase II/III-like protein